jgi:hypothetical protein
MAFIFLWFWDYALTFADEVCALYVWGQEGQSSQSSTQINYVWKGRKTWVFGLFLLVNAPPIQHSTASRRPNRPIEQVLPAAIPDMASRLSVTIPPSHFPIEDRLIGRRSLVVAGVHTRGVRRLLPIQRACTKLKRFPFRGGGEL